MACVERADREHGLPQGLRAFHGRRDPSAQSVRLSLPFDTVHESATQIAGEYVGYLLNTLDTADDNVATVTVEPVQDEGVYVPRSPEFLQPLRKASSSPRTKWPDVWKACRA